MLTGELSIRFLKGLWKKEVAHFMMLRVYKHNAIDINFCGALKHAFWRIWVFNNHS